MSKFIQARDYSGGIIPKFWVRNGRFYAALTIPGKGTRRVPLLTPSKQPATNITEAKAALVKVEYALSEGVAVTGSADCPTLEVFASGYIEHLTRTRAKDPLTIDKETCHLKRWIETTGGVKLDKISLAHVTRHVAARSQSRVTSNRTINLDVVVLGNLLRFAKDEGWVSRVVTSDWKPLKHTPPPALLLTHSQIELFNGAVRKLSDGGLVADFVSLMAYSGARRSSCFALKWGDVDFVRGQVTFSRETKFGKTIVVDFNPMLRSLLERLHKARTDASPYVLPNPNGQQNYGAIYRMIHQVRMGLGLPDFTPHLMRHFFASHCLMQGIDLATVADWLGHSDRGITLAKNYSHLLDSHRKLAAEKVSFGVVGAASFNGESFGQGIRALRANFCELQMNLVLGRLPKSRVDQEKGLSGIHGVEVF